MKVIENIFYANSTNPSQTLDIYLPDSDSFKVFVYFHGGGIEAGSKRAGKPFAEYLTSKNIALISAEYRMYPYAHYPEFICDAAAAVAWVFKNIEEYGKCEGIYVGGSSAGGYLSQMLCFDKKYLAPFKIQPMDIAGFIHDAGQPTTHFNVLRERGIDSRRVVIDEAAPLYHIGEDSEYPPMLFIVSDNDMPGRLEQTNLIIATLNHFGYDKEKYEVVYVENSKHCQYVWDNDEEKNTKKFAVMAEKYINKGEK